MVGRKPDVSAQPVTGCPPVHVATCTSLGCLSGGKCATFTRIKQFTSSYGRTLTPLPGLRLHSLISHELRAPCVTCERVPDLSGIMLLP